MRKIIAVLERFGHDWKELNGKVFGELWDGADFYWIEIKNVAHYESLTGEIEEGS